MKLDNTMIIVSVIVVIAVVGAMLLSIDEPVASPPVTLKTSESVDSSDTIKSKSLSCLVDPNKECKPVTSPKFTDLTKQKEPEPAPEIVLYNVLVGKTWYVVECEKYDYSCPKSFDRASIRMEFDCKSYDFGCERGIAEYKVLRDDKWYDIKCDVYDSKCPQNWEPEQ